MTVPTITSSTQAMDTLRDIMNRLTTVTEEILILNQETDLMLMGGEDITPEMLQRAIDLDEAERQMAQELSDFQREWEAFKARRDR